MCKDKKSGIKSIPAIIISVMLIAGAVIKIADIHPMVNHFEEMGLAPYLEILGTVEIAAAVLYLIPRTQKIGLLLLTAYLGGAMAAEIPYHMVTAPGIPLALVWITAFMRKPEQFIENPATKLSISKTAVS